MWRNDGELNTLLKQRLLSRKDDSEYIRLTRLVKKRVKFLRSEKIRLEAQEINDKHRVGKLNNYIVCSNRETHDLRI